MTKINAFETPILLITFNRLDTTKQVFSKIREQKPKKLYLASDAARIDKEGEDLKVNNVRKFLLDNIDWECEVFTLFQEKNLGCNHGPHSAITWFFEQEEKGIILEDDCLPSNSFFLFCETLLDYYKNDLRIFTIGGFNFLEKSNKVNNTYFFANFPVTWGWATWRNRWKKNISTIKNFSAISHELELKNLIEDSIVSKFIINNAKSAYKDEVDAWDFLWIFNSYINNALSIVPTKNLIQNIGFGTDSTHTNGSHENKLFTYHELNKPISHPKTLISDIYYDNYIYKEVFNWKGLSEKLFDANHIFKVIKNRIITK